MTTTALKAKVDQLGQIQKKKLFQLKISCTHFYNEPVDMLKRGEGNIIRGIFINYGELHNNYQHS